MLEGCCAILIQIAIFEIQQHILIILFDRITGQHSLVVVREYLNGVFIIRFDDVRAYRKYTRYVRFDSCKYLISFAVAMSISL